MNISKNILIACIGALMFAAPNSAKAQYADFSDYEIYSTVQTNPYLVKQRNVTFDNGLFKRSPRTGMNCDGQGGLFVAETAEKLRKNQFILSSRYRYHKLTSTKGQAFYNTEDGNASSLDTSVTYIGDWADWSVNIPVQSWELSAPRTMGGYSDSDNGLGNMSFGFKYTGLEDHSYYRFALGAVVNVNTGDSERMKPSSFNYGHQSKIFGCVTTKETDKATGNLELGAIFKKEGEDWFFYNFGLTYEITKQASFIGEVVGEVAGGDDKDNLDLVVGIRLAPTETFGVEFAYYRNLRTYREYGWDHQFQVGGILQW